MKVFVKNKKEVHLTTSNYVSSGGEGHIYAKNNTAYKIYTDPKKAISEGKIKELSILRNENIINPINTIYDNKGHVIGYTMKYIKKTISLCQIFTKAFKTRNNIKPDTVINLVNQLRDGIKYCHDNKILLVDINEFNFLLNDNKFDTLYFIDVDSYKTENYDATALMDSVRDRHAKAFSENTDWFSFGIIAFQMFTGIHPYKGKHNRYKTLNERMLHNISVFNSEVKKPPTAYDFDVIPNAYEKWMRAVFEEGKRIIPPFNEQMSIVISTATWQKKKSNQSFTIELVTDYCSEIITYVEKNHALTTTGFHFHKYINNEVAPYSHIIKKEHFISAIVKDEKLKLKSATTNLIIPVNLNAEKIFTYNNNLFYKWKDGIYVLNFTQVFGPKIFIQGRKICNVLENATDIYAGVVIQKLLGAYFVSIFPTNKEHYQIKVKEITEHRIINAKYEKNVLVILAEKQGLIDEFIIVFNEKFDAYSCRVNNDISYFEINFVVNDSGICIKETHEGFIEIFKNENKYNQIKLIEDTSLSGTKLFNEGNTVFFSRKSELYKVGLNK